MEHRYLRRFPAASGRRCILQLSRPFAGIETFANPDRMISLRSFPVSQDRTANDSQIRGMGQLSESATGWKLLRRPDVGLEWMGGQVLTERNEPVGRSSE